MKRFEKVCEEFFIEYIEPEGVNSETFKDFLASINTVYIMSNSLIVTKDFYISVCNSRCSSCTKCCCLYGIRTYFLHTKKRKRTLYDFCEIICIIEIKFENISKSVSEWTRETRKLCCCTNKGKLWYIHLYTRCSCSRSNHDIYLKVFHSRIEDFLDLWFEPMDFIDKENFSLYETRKKRYDI